jgi:hypothetical protein
MVDLTSVILPPRSSAWETGVGNLPAARLLVSVGSKGQPKQIRTGRTLGKTGAEQTRNLLDEGLGGNERIVLAGELLDELLVLVELLQVIGGHGVDTTMLGTIEIMLVTEDADAHVGTGHGRQLDGAGETLVTLGIIVLEADLELDGLEEVTLLGLVGVGEELLDLSPDVGC